MIHDGPRSEPSSCHLCCVSKAFPSPVSVFSSTKSTALSHALGWEVHEMMTVNMTNGRAYKAEGS